MAVKKTTINPNVYTPFGQNPVPKPIVHPPAVKPIVLPKGTYGPILNTPAPDFPTEHSPATNDAGVTTSQTIPTDTIDRTTAAIQGYTPDYDQLVRDDAILGQQDAARGTQALADANTRRLGTNQALIDFGEVPNLNDSTAGLGLDPNSAMYKMLFGDIDPATSQAASANTNSTTAQLARTHTTALARLQDQLAARGIIRSGALGSGVNTEDTNYSGQQYNARNTLLQYLGGLQSAFAQSEAARSAAHGTDLAAAMQREMALHPYIAAQPGTDYAGNPQTYDQQNPAAVDTPAPPAPPAPSPPAAAPPPAVSTVGTTDNPAIYQQLGRKTDPRYAF